MTIAVLTTKVRYNGNGVTSSFAFTFGIDDNTELEVYEIDMTDPTAPVEQLLTLSTDYTVTFTQGVEGGTVVTTGLFGAIATDHDILIKRVTTQEQQLELLSNTVMDEGDLESAYDKAVKLIQELQEILDRVPKFAVISETTDITFPEPSAGKAIRWNDAGTDLQNSTSTFDSIVTDALAAQAAAEAAQAAAEAAQVAAELAETNAETAETNAETAETNAEAAQVAAEAAAATATAANFYTMYATQSLAAASSMTITNVSRQYRRVQSSGGLVDLSATPFGTNPALFTSGMEIIVAGQNDSNAPRIIPADVQYGILSKTGDARFQKNCNVSYIYDATIERFVELFRSF